MKKDLLDDFHEVILAQIQIEHQITRFAQVISCTALYMLGIFVVDNITLFQTLFAHFFPFLPLFSPIPYI